MWLAALPQGERPVGEKMYESRTAISFGSFRHGHVKLRRLGFFVWILDQIV
jgi:hypothetical protein